MLEIGIRAAARQAGAVVREGFTAVWSNKHIGRPGHWMYVERAAFAQAALALVRNRGIEVHSFSALPPLAAMDNGVAVFMAGAWHFEEEDTIILPDGTAIRWLSGVDPLPLRAYVLSRASIPSLRSHVQPSIKAGRPKKLARRKKSTAHSTAHLKLAPR